MRTFSQNKKKDLQHYNFYFVYQSPLSTNYQFAPNYMLHVLVHVYEIIIIYFYIKLHRDKCFLRNDW